MSLVFAIPTEVAAHLVSKWLKVSDVCKLEVAMCSPTDRLNLMTVYESAVIKCEPYSRIYDKLEYQLDWMIVRKIRASTLHLLSPVPRSAVTKLISIISSSKSLVKSFELGDDCEVVDTLMMVMAQYCKHLTFIEVGDCTLGTSFVQLLASSPLLEELIVNNCTGLQSSYFAGLLCPSVKTLRVDGWCDPDIQIALLVMCPELTYYKRYDGESADLSAIPSTLEELSVEYCTSLVNMQLKKGLLHLTLVGVEVNDETLIQIMTMCPVLESIKIDGTSILNARSISLLGDKYSQTLTSLTLGSIDAVDHFALEDVCKKSVLFCAHLMSAVTATFRHLRPRIYLSGLRICSILTFVALVSPIPRYSAFRSLIWRHLACTTLMASLTKACSR